MAKDGTNRRRPSIFRDKDHRFQGMLSKVGKRSLEAHKRDLGALFKAITGRSAGSVSDADATEYALRGEADTRAYIEAHREKA